MLKCCCYVAWLLRYHPPQEADHFCDLYEGERKAVAAAVKGYRLALGERPHLLPCTTIITVTTRHHIAAVLVRPQCVGAHWHLP